MNEVKQLPPMKCLASLTHGYPGIWEFLDTVRCDARYRELYDHSRSWTTTTAVLSFGCRRFSVTPKTYPEERMEEIPVIEALAGWRQGKNVYDFDPALTEVLYRESLRPIMVSTELLRLPCFTLYIQPNFTDDPDEPYGKDFYVYWCGKALCFLTVRGRRADILFSLIMEEGEETLAECIERSARIYADNTGHQEAHSAYEAFRGLIQRWLSLVLYLTAVNADVRRDERHVFRRTRQVRDIPREVEFLHVGEETAIHLRTLGGISSAPSSCDRGGHHRSPVLHLRRAHWHTYHMGSRKLALRDRKTVLKWIAPVIVNGGGRDVVTVSRIRRVGKKS